MCARRNAAAGLLMLACVSAWAEEVAPTGQQAPEESPPTELGPITVTPRHDNDPLFEADRKLHDLLNSTPCLGCDAPKRKPGTIEKVGKYLLDKAAENLLPQEPPKVDDDPQSRAEAQSTRRVDRPTNLPE